MISFHWPTLNASLNGMAAVFLLAGFIAIKMKKQKIHQSCMLAAFFVSFIFLLSYLLYHYNAGSTRFEGEGWIRIVYFSILISHTVLAVAVVPLVIVTLRWALKKDFLKHKKWARRTWPVWMYVSITGVVVYWLLYHFPN